MSEKNEAVTVREMRSIELNAEYLGVSRLQLMENAGRAVADAVSSRFGIDSSVSVFLGTGGNGGDGMVTARILSSQGYHVAVCLVGRECDLEDDVVFANWAILRNLSSSVRIEILNDSSQVKPVNCDVVIDAILGIGAKGALRPPITQVTNTINNSSGFKVAVDVPTGVNSETGESDDSAIRADLTVTFHRAKKGLLKAKKYVGELVVVSVGIPVEAELFVGPGDVATVTKHRPAESHKGDFGRLVVIGGSEMYTGAPAYVALAAQRTGVDLAYVVAPERAADTIAAFSPNLITIGLKGPHLKEQHIERIDSLLEKATAIAVGPGLGTHEETFKALDQLLDLLEKSRKPVLLDADALKALGRNRRRIEVPCILTPHLGEFEAISGTRPPPGVGSMDTVRQVAKEYNATILLKGNVDVVSDGKRVKLNRTGNPGMTAGGTGDVLSGIAAALLAQGFHPFEAACGAAFINGASGDFVFREKGAHLVATDLIDYIPVVMSDPMSHKKIRDLPTHR